ncbi:ROK family transcriptional regulator [Kineosporia sp. J2-2]|uniref:ROK family transcriptional regulator n=1 Tax=Kineosporia corallincola TaxID=2835133 RepID=A0ABS5TGN9_9ACTN|nr:ROK family transcriptional regulator [Kineosporia corallincola]MBT0770257.1 ROK family transcriptional regulator [Kineosporia corallincola]
MVVSQGKSVGKAGRTSGVRRGNVEKVLEALRAHGPSSQAALARRTDLSAATVNSIVRGLRDEGIAEVQALNGRESQVALVAEAGVIVSVQVNVDAVHAVLFDLGRRRRLDAHLDQGRDFATDGAGPEDVVGLVRGLVGRAGLAVSDLTGVAVAMQGPIHRRAGTLVSWARLQMPNWSDVPVASTLAEALGVAVVAENDANLAALAEWTWGAGHGVDDFLFVMCSSGIGGGIVIDGRIYRGGDGLAGEIGHIILEQHGPVCFCGSRGCLTTFASERSILLALEGSGSVKEDLPEVIAAAHRGDPACQRVLWEAGRYLGRALANTAKAMAPSVVAIGGLLGEAGPLVFDSVRSSAEINSLLAVSPDVRFVPAVIGDDAALFGGVAAVLTLGGQGVSSLPQWMKS